MSTYTTNTPPLQLTLPAPVAQRRAVGLDLMTVEVLESWWANVWRDLGLPDPAACTLEEFRMALKGQPHE